MLKLFAATITIDLMMEAESTSETLVNVYQTTQCNIPEDSHFHKMSHSECTLSK
jgi:hypothetical protein